MKASYRDCNAASSGSFGAASEDRERRTIIVERSAGSFGFTLQSYGIHYRNERDVEIITYVDYVDPNGPAYRAGLRTGDHHKLNQSNCYLNEEVHEPGDVLLSINGQDVERANHATLVSIIQSCPSRIRMVVLFENCVRKVELHMRYIHLQNELKRKEQEYQKMCATERLLINKLSMTRRGSHSSMASTVQPSPSTFQPGYCDQNRTDACDYGCTSTTQIRSSKSLPRSILKSSRSFIQATETREGSRTVERKKDHGRSSDSTGCFKRSSYFCIGNGGCDCDSCYREESQHFENSKASKSYYRSSSVHLQRPKSCHFPSCYQASEDEVPLPTPCAQSKIDLACRSYGGYGFGYQYNVASTSNSPLHYPTYQPRIRGLASANIAYERLSQPKSAEDLLSAQFNEHCQMQTSQLAATAGAGLTGSTEAITFYTRPSQPKPASLTPVKKMNQSRSRTDRQSSTKTAKSPCDDEGGFDQIRPFRTLPLVRRPM